MERCARTLSRSTACYLGSRSRDLLEAPAPSLRSRTKCGVTSGIRILDLIVENFDDDDTQTSPGFSMSLLEPASQVPRRRERIEYRVDQQHRRQSAIFPERQFELADRRRS